MSSKELHAQLIQDIKNLGADDDELLVFDCFLDGMTKPKDIRTELGISKKEFHNIWRKLLRKRNKIAIKLYYYGK